MPYARVDLIGMHRWLSRGSAAALSLVLCSIAVACGSASQSITGPGGVKCAVGASAETTSFGASGGSATVRVTANRECRWTASSSGAWIQLNGGREGQGDAQIPFSVSANPDPARRLGAIVIGDKQIAIAQEPAACRFTVSPLAAKVAPAGERRTIEVTANGAQCAWTARSDREWLAVLEGANVTGNGRVVYEARATSGPTRTGTLVVAGHTVTITQGAGCSTSVSPASYSIGASGGSAALSVAAGPGCRWTASSDAPWITIGSGSAGAGPGTVTITVGSWNGPTRTGTVRVNDQIVTITQTAGCSYSLSSTASSVDAAGGRKTVSVTAAAGCSWTTSVSEPWIRVISGASGNGPGTVEFEVDPNSGPQRSGTVNIAGIAHTITQSGACSYSIDPASRSFDAAGGADSVAVTAVAGCSWSAVSSEGWVQITGGGSGTGSGTVGFAVAENTGPERSATIFIAGLSFTVQQASGCTFTLSAPGQTYDAAAHNDSVSVVTAAGCAWNATSSADWIVITAGTSGDGDGRIEFSVAANPGATRGGEITVGGQTFTIAQTGA